MLNDRNDSQVFRAGSKHAVGFALGCSRDGSSWYNTLLWTNLFMHPPHVSSNSFGHRPNCKMVTLCMLAL